MKDICNIAKNIRVNALNCVYKSQSSHIGSGFSCADILTVLYGRWLNVKSDNLNDPNRDRFILSKGHAAAVYYSTLAEFNFIPKEWLLSYCLFGSKLGGHASHSVPGVEFSSGSLGHGLPAGVGMALGGKRAGMDYRVVVLMSDGEMDSGSNWEAILFAAGQKLDNLLAIVDRNQLQAMGFTKDIVPLGDLANKFEAFGWSAKTIEGHDFNSITDVLDLFPFSNGKPSVIIANTIKGKGVSFMENRLEWHYKSPNEDEFKKAMKELDLP
ncbi:transketolase [Candidatus Latescibacterota bacterium]